MSPKDEALLCVGRCQQKVHRYCVSVSEHHYRALCESRTPFLCPACYREQHEGEVNELKNTVEALRMEVSQLKELIRELREGAESPVTVAKPAAASDATNDNVIDPPLSASRPDQPWKTATSRRSRKKSKSTSKDDNGPAETRKSKNIDEASGRSRRPREPRWVSVKSLGNATHEKGTGGNTGDDSEYPTVGNSNVKQPCEEVEGVRRIWGTMRGCSSKTILTALQRLSTVSDEIEVRRKFKKKNNSVQWWFLVRGTEATLQSLEQQWERIRVQTSWKLERCHKPASSEVPPANDNNPGVSSFLAQK